MLIISDRETAAILRQTDPCTSKCYSAFPYATVASLSLTTAAAAANSGVDASGVGIIVVVDRLVSVKHPNYYAGFRADDTDPTVKGVAPNSE